MISWGFLIPGFILLLLEEYLSWDMFNKYPWGHTVNFALIPLFLLGFIAILASVIVNFAMLLVTVVQFLLEKLTIPKSKKIYHLGLGLGVFFLLIGLVLPIATNYLKTNTQKSFIYHIMNSRQTQTNPIDFNMDGVQNLGSFTFSSRTTYMVVLVGDSATQISQIYSLELFIINYQDQRDY